MSNKKYIIILLALAAVLTNGIDAQNSDIIYNVENQNITGKRYVTDPEGNVRIWVNIWGQVNKPGNYLVYDGIDIITLLAVAGGLKDGANLNQIRYFREFPDENMQQAFTFNMNAFYRNGDRTLFPQILPNDAYIVTQKMSSFLLSKVGVANTLMSALNLYYLTVIRQDQLK